MNLLLVRHGEILSNIKNIYAGKSPEGLTVNGISQAESIANTLKNHEIHALYSSPVRRAVQTSEIIGNRTGKDYLIEDNFREMELGPWEGLSEEKIPGLYPKEWRIWMSRPAELRLNGRETLKALLERVLDGIRNIYKDSADENVLVVTHVAIIRVLLLWHSKKSLNLYKTIHVPNAELFKLKVNGLDMDSASV